MERGCDSAGIGVYPLVRPSSPPGRGAASMRVELVFALLRLERAEHNRLVAQLWLAGRVGMVRQRVAQEVDVVAGGEVRAVVAAAALFACQRPGNRRLGALD